MFFISFVKFKEWITKSKSFKNKLLSYICKRILSRDLRSLQSSITSSTLSLMFSSCSSLKFILSNSETRLLIFRLFSLFIGGDSCLLTESVVKVSTDEADVSSEMETLGIRKPSNFPDGDKWFSDRAGFIWDLGVRRERTVFDGKAERSIILASDEDEIDSSSKSFWNIYNEIYDKLTKNINLPNWIVDAPWTRLEI